MPFAALNVGIVSLAAIASYFAVAIAGGAVAGYFGMSIYKEYLAQNEIHEEIEKIFDLEGEFEEDENEGELRA